MDNDAGNQEIFANIAINTRGIFNLVNLYLLTITYATYWVLQKGIKFGQFMVRGEKMFTKLTEKDFEYAISLISKINRSAKCFFQEACEKDSFVTSLMYKSESNTGIFCIIEEEEFFVSYISFLHDLQDEKAFQEMFHHLSNVIETKGGKDLYLNANGLNRSVCSFIRENRFDADGAGCEYRYTLSAATLPESQLECKTFEMEHADQYLELIDEAFTPLDLACNVEPNAMRRDRERSIESIEKVNEKDNFRAFWLDDALIGVYFLKNDVLNILAVHPRYQRQGYGKEILQFCLHHMINEKQIPEVYLYVIDKNEGAHHFYLNNGFTVTGCYSENTYRSNSV